MVNAEESGEVTAQVPLLAPCTEAGRVAISARFLVEYLKGQEGIVTMGVKDHSSPVLFTAPGMPEVVIMPMAVQWAGKASRPVPDTQAQSGEIKHVENEGSSPKGVEAVKDRQTVAQADDKTAKKPRTRKISKASLRAGRSE